MIKSMSSQQQIEKHRDTRERHGPSNELTKRQSTVSAAKRKLTTSLIHQRGTVII